MEFGKMQPPRDVFKKPAAAKTTRFQLDINGKMYDLYEGLNTIGRNSKAVVNIKSVNVSQCHAIITVVNDTMLFISDMKSSNGTELESQKLEPLHLYKLDDNARIKFANVCGVFKKNAAMRERNEALSQDVSQGFYAEATQPMFEDIHDMPTQVQDNIHEIATQMASPRIEIHEMPTQLFETSAPACEVAPPEAFLDSSSHDASVDYFMPSTSVVVAPSNELNETAVEDVDNLIVVNGDESDGCSQFPVGRVKRKSNPLDSPDRSPEECSQIPIGRVKRKANPFDSPERSSEELLPEESQIPARPKSQKFDSSPSLEDEVAEVEGTVVKRKSIYALSSDSDTDLEDDVDKKNTTTSSDVIIPCTQEYSCLTESFNLQLDETQAQIIVDDKENISMNVEFNLSNEEDEIVDETIYEKSPEAAVTCVLVKQQEESSKRQEVSMDLTCISVKQGESSKRHEVSMDLTCTSVKSTQEKQNGRVPVEAIPEEDEEQTQLVYSEPVGNNDVAVLAEDEAVSKDESSAAEQTEERDAAINIEPTEDEDDIYLQPTQCFNKSEPRIVATQDLQPTQVLKADATNDDCEKEASQQINIVAEETSKLTQGLDLEVETIAEETVAEEIIAEEKSFVEEKTTGCEGVEDNPEENDGKYNAISKNTDEQQTDEQDKELNEIPETQATCSKDLRTVVVLSKSSDDDASEKIDGSVEAGIATLFMNDTNVRDQSSGESVEDQLKMLFHTQIQEEDEAFACTQHLVKALEDSGAKTQDDSIDNIPSTQTLVATLNKSDVCDDDRFDQTSSQPLTLTKDAQVRTYSKAASSSSGGGSCSSDATVVEMPIIRNSVEETGAADRIEEIYVGNQSSSASVEVKLDDGREEATKQVKKSVRVSTRRQSKASPEQTSGNSDRTNEEEDEQFVEATPKPRQSSRNVSLVKKRFEELVKETPKTKVKEASSKQKSTPKQGPKKRVVVESDDDWAEELGSARQSAAINEAKTASRSSSRTPIEQPKPDTSKQPDEASSKQKSTSKQDSNKKVVESGNDSAEELGSTRQSAAINETKTASRSSSRTRIEQAKPSTSKQPDEASSKQKSTSKQGPKKSVVVESGDDSAEELGSTRQSAAINQAKTASRSSSRTPSEQPKPGTSKQPDETPKLGRGKRTPTALKPPENNAKRTRGSKTPMDETEEKEDKQAPKTRTKRKTNEAEDEAKPQKKTKLLYTDSSDEFEEPSPQVSPKKQIVVTKTKKKGGGAVEKVKVVVPKVIEDEVAKSEGRATQARRLSAHSRSVRNAAQAQEDEAKASTSSRKRTAKRDVIDEEAPPVKKSLGDTPERNRRKTKPKVIFTMMDDPGLESMVRQLGGSVVDSVSTSTVLVTGSVKRSLKLLMAVGCGKPICSPQWIRASKKSSNFLDPWEHILVDKEAEKKWDFSLRESLNRSQNFRLFDDYTFQICVTVAVDVLKGAIEACGGKVVTKGLAKCTTKNLVVVGTKDVEKKYAKIIKDNPRVIAVEPEAIFDGTLRQELRFDKHLIK